MKNVIYPIDLNEDLLEKEMILERLNNQNLSYADQERLNIFNNMSIAEIQEKYKYLKCKKAEIEIELNSLSKLGKLIEKIEYLENSKESVTSDYETFKERHSIIDRMFKEDINVIDKLYKNELKAIKKDLLQIGIQNDMDYKYWLDDNKQSICKYRKLKYDLGEIEKDFGFYQKVNNCIRDYQAYKSYKEFDERMAEKVYKKSKVIRLEK